MILRPMQAPRAAFLGCILLATAAFQLSRVQVGQQPDRSYLLPNGQWITPAGTHITVDDRPLGMVLSPDGATLAVVTGSNFASRQIALIDVRARTVSQSIGISHSFVGVAFSRDGASLFVGGGPDNDVKIFRRQQGGNFSAAGSVAISGSEPSGLSVDAGGATVYAALNLRHSVAIVNVQAANYKEVPAGIYPYTTVVARDGSKVYVSNWGGRRAQTGDATDGVRPVVVDPNTGIASTGTVSVLDAKSQAIVRQIEVGLHPSGMALSPDGRRLYVTNANSDSVSVIRTSGDTVEKTIDVRPFANAPPGSAPNAVAVSPDGRRIYVANGANNAIAVVEPDSPDRPVRGFIPTGWFPTAVAVSSAGDALYVASGYGFGSVANPGKAARSFTDRTGVVSIVPLPDDATLARYTRQVLLNNGFGPVGTRGSRGRAPILADRFDPAPIRHVFYIIKENRTYDQVLGDLPQGNGMPSLVQFGRNVTPNHHALAEQFVLMDNFYAAGDQSALGHQWTDEAYANDYVHKYGNLRNDYAGTNPMAYAPSGFLWDHARNHGLAVRVYGEFASTTSITPATATWTSIYAAWRSGAAGPAIQAGTSVAGVRGILAPHYPGFDMRITDQRRADEFLNEFHQFEQNGNLPNLVIVLLPVDHTNGTSPGYPTPRAMVADNDLALGRIVEAISRSRYWRESAIFITEDDAQDGTDHVDGHRTVGLLASPYVRRGIVDRNFYSTISMFRTIEEILGLPPLNQFDAAARPMWRLFTGSPDFAPYTALPNQVPLDEMNPPVSGLRGLQKRLAEASLKMDFSMPDAAPEDLLNRAVWHSVRGYTVPYPDGEK
jgi:YVTN family beta-propeller protein